MAILIERGISAIAGALADRQFNVATQDEDQPHETGSKILLGLRMFQQTRADEFDGCFLDVRTMLEATAKSTKAGSRERVGSTIHRNFPRPLPRSMRCLAITGLTSRSRILGRYQTES